MNKSILRRFGALLTALTLTVSLVTLPAAAEEENTAEYTVTITPVSATSLTLTVGDVDKTISELVTVTVAKTVDNSTVTNAVVTWSSGDGEVFTVTGNKIHAVAGGTARLTATYSDPSDATKTFGASCEITVAQDIGSITLYDVASGAATTTEGLTLSKGASLKLRYAATPTTATERAVWSLVESTASSVLTLVDNKDTTCTITGLKPGKATVKAAAADDGVPEATCVVEVSGLVPAKDALDLVVGADYTLDVTPYGKAKDQSVVWSSSNISVAEVVDGKIIAHYPGTAVIKAVAGAFSATCTVTVEEDVAEAIELTLESGEVLPFTALLSDLNNRSKEKTDGAALSYLNGLQVSTDAGVLYYGYASPESRGTGVGNGNYYVAASSGQLSLNKVTFVPNADFSGTAVIYYTGRGTNGRSFNGTIRVSVNAAEDVSYSTVAGETVYFLADDFSAVCRETSGGEVVSISFVPPAFGKGTLHYNYGKTNWYNPEVSSDLSFFRTKAPYLDEVAFVPAENFTGTVTIPYYCTTTGENFSGAVTIYVSSAGNSIDSGRITYYVASGGQVNLDVDDLNIVCKDILGSTLDYVYFDLPAAGEGTLYYNYTASSNYGTKVASNVRYYCSYSPRINYVSFVADGNFRGSVLISFTGYGVNGQRFNGEIIIQVGDSDGVITYASRYGETIRFDGADFNELCLDINGQSLSYVYFELPRTSVGVLYRSTSYSSSTKVSSTTRFYRGTGMYNKIDNVIFKPNSNFVGTVDIPFYGYDVDTNYFSGVVRITVKQQEGDPVVSYKTISGGWVAFDVDAFDVVCQALTGDRLDYVNLSLPAYTQGRLYYNYSNKTNSGTGVFAFTNYYYAEDDTDCRLLGNVSFLAGLSYTGTISLQYTGVSTGGRSYTGKIEITVSEPSDVIVDYIDGSGPILLDGSDFEKAYKEISGHQLSYIRFTDLPATSCGKLYLGYTEPAYPGTAVELGTNYTLSGTMSINRIVFVPTAGYNGYVSVPYTGWDTRGESLDGVLRFYISGDLCTTSFSDLENYGWATPSIEFLQRTKIVNGYTDGTYRPGNEISRAEFALMVYQAFRFEGDGSTYSFPDVPESSIFAEAIATLKAKGIVQGDNGMYRPGSSITRQNAMTMVWRAMEATNRIVPNVSTSILSNFTDGSLVATYAQTPVSTMVYLGAVDGDSDNNLRPTEAVTRAEMAVIMHYVLTHCFY